jgi:hypothetical protein
MSKNNSKSKIATDANITNSEEDLENQQEIKNPRRSKVMTKKKLEKKILSGAGQCHGSKYESWLTIRRKNTSPDSNQVVSWMPMLNRVAHYLSLGEYQTALLLLWLGIQDLREQFPLWPVSHPHPLTGANGTKDLKLKWSPGMLVIAKQARIKHGVEVGTHIPYVATIDLMATVKLSDRVKLFGFSSKAILDDLGDMKFRTLERLEMERSYMADINESYYVIDSELVPDIMAGQLDHWMTYSTTESLGEISQHTAGFANYLNSNTDLSISEGVEMASENLSISLDSAWLLFRHCAWTQLIDIDPTVQVLTSYPIQHGGRSLRKKLREKLFGEDWS